MLVQIALQDKKGFTLVEVMIALVVTLVVFLALMQTALVSIDSNMINVLRNEAVSIAEMRMNEARNQGFDTIVDDSIALPSPRDCPATFTNGIRYQRNIRNVASKDFCTNLDVTDLNVDNKQVNITVGWRWKEQDYTHSITSILRRQ